MEIIVHTNCGDHAVVTLNNVRTLEAAADFLLKQEWIKTDEDTIIFVRNISIIDEA